MSFHKRPAPTLIDAPLPGPIFLLATLFCGTLLSAASVGGAETVNAPPDRAMQTQLSPDEVMALLLEGNERFRAGQTLDRDWPDQVRQTSGAQYPLAMIVNCIDSRVPVEVIFDQGLGSLFNVRVAGNVVGNDALGSLEYAVEIAGTRLILVLGHTHCGAVKGAMHGVELGHLTGLLAKIHPAMAKAAKEAGNAVAPDAGRVTELNVRHVMEEIEERSDVLRQMMKSGSLVVRGAVYDIETGRVHLLDN